MGLVSSQTRWVSLTARKMDLEYQGQQINQQRLQLAAQEEQLSKNYSDALNETVININYVDNTGTTYALPLSTANLTRVNVQVVDQNGSVIPSDTNSAVIQQGLQDGEYTTQTNTGTTSNPDWVNFAWNGTLPNGSISPIQSSINTDGQAQAEAVYEAALGEIEPQDKTLEMNLKDVDTQHQAIITEMDAVKKVIDKDIDSTFKTFLNNA